MALAVAAAAVLVGLLASGAAGDQFIHPGGPTTPHWNDTQGNRIESHAAGMLMDKQSGRWFWYGESKKTGNLSEHGVNCYSATDLGGPWRFEGQVVKQTDVRASQPGPYVIERPKVLYNNHTGMYVMWFHLDTAGYKFRHVGVAQSPSPTGPFAFVHAMQPDGVPSLDMSLWRDPFDGEAYFVRSCDNKYNGFSRLTPDYLNSTGMISRHSPVFEGMALFRHPNGTYYIITSHLTGWNPNPLILYRAAGSTLDDPQWVSMGNPTGSPTSFDSQPTYVVPVTTEGGEHYFMYMGDNWVHGGPAGLIDASYVWLPMKFSANAVSLSFVWEWDMQHPFAPPPPPPPPSQALGLK